MTINDLTPDQQRALIKELVAFEISEANSYGEPITRAAAEAKVRKGLGLAR